MMLFDGTTTQATCECEVACSLTNSTYICGYPAPFYLIRAKPWFLDVAEAKSRNQIPGKIDENIADAVAISVCPMHYERGCS